MLDGLCACCLAFVMTNAPKEETDTERAQAPVGEVMGANAGGAKQAACGCRLGGLDLFTAFSAQ